MALSLKLLIIFVVVNFSVKIYLHSNCKEKCKSNINTRELCEKSERENYRVRRKREFTKSEILQ